MLVSPMVVTAPPAFLMSVNDLAPNSLPASKLAIAPTPAAATPAQLNLSCSPVTTPMPWLTRLLAAEVTREQLYLQLHKELPYSSAIETEQYKEREDGSVEIHQQILVERETQRAIVLGKGGTRIKEIGARARAELSRLMGVKVHLYLHVKVRPEWQEDRSLYREIGLDWVE